MKESETLLNQNKLTKTHGPCVQELDKQLNMLNVQRQAFYGGTFIGNHVHKMLKVRFYPIICNYKYGCDPFIVV